MLVKLVVFIVRLRADNSCSIVIVESLKYCLRSYKMRFYLDNIGLLVRKVFFISVDSHQNTLYFALCSNAPQILNDNNPILRHSYIFDHITDVKWRLYKLRIKMVNFPVPLAAKCSDVITML